MKVLPKILLTFAMVVGLSLAVFAQKDEQKVPRKQKPPVITPAPAKPAPKKEDKNKKSSIDILLVPKESLDVLA
jgi:hypothetical protein